MNVLRHIGYQSILPYRYHDVLFAKEEVRKELPLDPFHTCITSGDLQYLIEGMFECRIFILILLKIATIVFNVKASLCLRVESFNQLVQPRLTRNDDHILEFHKTLLSLLTLGHC